MSWEEYTGIDVTSRFKGITAPLNELYADIERRGWQVKSVKFKKDAYEATGKKHGEERVGRGPDEKTAVGNLLIAITRRDFMRSKVQRKVGMWQTTFTGQLEDVAKAYAQAPIYDNKAVPAWLELAQDSTRRAQIIGTQLKIEATDDPEPYKSPQEMFKDIHENKHFIVSRAHADHPVWSTDQTVAFRIAHDVLGHAVSGGDFGWVGENMACAAHFPLLSETAQKALFTECIGQAAYAAYYRGFGPHKVAFLDDFMDPAQEQENPDAHQGIHPSQSIIPTQTPMVPPSPPVGLPVGSLAPHQEALGLTPVLTKTAAGEAYVDPNAGWSPDPNIPYENARTGYGDPLQAFEPKGVLDTAGKVDTGWNNLTEQEATQAIVNAFRVTILSPRKNLRWNAIQYQDIAHIPADVTDPMRYQNALEGRRQYWNAARGFDPESHKFYKQALEQYISYVASHAKELGYDYHAAREIGERDFFHMVTEQQELIAGEDEDKPETDQRNAQQIEDAAIRRVMKILKGVTKPKPNRKTDITHPQLFAATTPDVGEPGFDPLSYDPNDPTLGGGGNIQDAMDRPQGEIADKERYGAWMGTQINPVAQISKYAEGLLAAARKDVEDHDGSGHHFRAYTLSLGIKGIGPKVVSFTWLLLQPLTSQLATIDAHMMNVLGYDPKTMNNRDYFRFERELAARRDASGYSNVPLGAFQWGMWDYKRTGPGSGAAYDPNDTSWHQDHSAMRALDAMPHQYVSWADKGGGGPVSDWTDPNQVGQLAPWWAATQPYADAVRADWEQNVAPNFNADQIPYRTVPINVLAKAANAGTVPYFINPDGLTVEGQPGQSLMSHLRGHYGQSTEEVWAADPQVGKR